MEKLKAPLSYCSFIIQILRRRKRKSWEVSQILIRHDQSALYTAAAKCSLFPWHFWVREHFIAVLCVLERGVGGGGWGRTDREGWQDFCESLRSVLALASLLSVHSGYVSHFGGVPLFFLYCGSLADT